MRNYILLCAGIFNPAFATYRMAVTTDTHLSRVVGAWAMTSKVAQPACIAAAGLLWHPHRDRAAVPGAAGLRGTAALYGPASAPRNHIEIGKGALMTEQALAGGRFADPARDGDTVTRRRGPAATNLHALLEFPVKSFCSIERGKLRWSAGWAWRAVV